MATKIQVAQQRLFRNIFICKSCGRKIRASSKKIAGGNVKCRRCRKNLFRAKRKK